jgi:hypothetical protein
MRSYNPPAKAIVPFGRCNNGLAISMVDGPDPLDRSGRCHENGDHQRVDATYVTIYSTICGVQSIDGRVKFKE